MNKRLDRKEAVATYQALNIEQFISFFERVGDRINDIIQVESFKGKTARAMKSYFGEVHLLTVKSFLIILMELDHSIKRFFNEIDQVDISDEAIINEEYLDHLQELTKKYRREWENDNHELLHYVERASRIQGIGISVNDFERGMQRVTDELLAMEALTDNTADALYQFNFDQQRSVTSLLHHADTLRRTVEHLEGVMSGNITDFKSGSFLRSDLGRELFNHMLSSALEMAQNGSILEAINAFSLIGGYLSTLPTHLRRKFEALKGRTIQNAFIGDPVNAATGNFIYDHLDLTINGRHPLEFKRFYNSLDDYDGGLGRNWCHNYDIRIQKLEGGGVTVIYGDSRQEHYEKPKPDSTTFITSLGNYNELQTFKIENSEGFLLTFPDGSEYHFNEAGKLFKQCDSSGNAVTLTYNDNQLIKVENLSGSLTFSYEDDFIKTVTDHSGRSITYSFENDLLIEYTNPLGNSYLHEYDIRKRLVKITHPDGNLLVENHYDDQDRTNKQIYADGTKMEYHYHEYKKETTFIKQNGSQFTYKRDSDYRTTGIIEPDGEIQIEYNGSNQRTKTIDKLKNETAFAYNKKGSLVKITNALGVVTELDHEEKTNQLTSIKVDGKEKISNLYNEAGDLISIKDALQNETILTYKKKGLSEVITQADGSQIQLSYDECENIVQIKDASGVVTQYQYDQLNRVICTIDGNQNATYFTYDDQDNILAVKNAADHTQHFVYNKMNKVTCITDWGGGQIKREYNALGKLAKIIDQLDRETAFDYDPMWNVSKITAANGAETTFHYNTMNHLEKMTKPDQTTLSYEYDLNGNCTKVTDELGNQTHLAYDVLNQLIEVKGEDGLHYTYTYNDEGRVASVTDALNHTVTLEYNELNQLTRETNALGDSRAYTYTVLGAVETVTDEAGRKTHYKYEPGGRLKSIIYPDQTSESFTYDNNSNIRIHTNQLGNPTTYTYDCLNRITAIETANGKKQYRYDAMSNIISTVDESGNSTNYEYTLTGKLAKVTDALGNSTAYSYDLLDQLIEVRQHGSIEANADLERVTKYQRNLLGQITQIKDALGNKEMFSYNPKGELTEKLDKDGYLTKYGYTKQGDINRIQYADGREVWMSYNPLRQLTEIKDWLGTTQIEVDALGRPKKVIDHHNQVVKYTWGKVGERQSLTYPDGKVLHYEHDGALRLIGVVDGEHRINYSYDSYSRLTEKAFVNGTKTQFGYNQLGELASLKHLNQEQVLDHYQYQYDVLGNKTSVEKARRGLEVDSGVYTYSYDPLNRLTEVIKDGNLLRNYSYDSFGNRTSMMDNGIETSYTYNPLNQLVSSHSKDGIEQIFSYDNRGNLTEIHKNNALTHQYQFGALNRLEKAINQEQGLSSLYHYNGLSHRVGQTVEDINLNPTKQIDDVLDLTKQYHHLLQRKENQTLTSFTYDFGLLSADANPYFLDDLGSPVRFGNEVFGYDEFGGALHQSSSTQPFGFTGYRQDPIAGNYFAQARQYDPTTGRFVSEDKIKGFIEFPQSLNPYSYCWSQPLNLVDLDGMFPFPVTGLSPTAGTRWSDVTSWWNEHIFGQNLTIKSSGNLNDLGFAYYSVSHSTSVGGNIIVQNITDGATTGFSVNTPTIFGNSGLFSFDWNNGLNLSTNRNTNLFGYRRNQGYQIGGRFDPEIGPLSLDLVIGANWGSNFIFSNNIHGAGFKTGINPFMNNANLYYYQLRRDGDIRTRIEAGLRMNNTVFLLAMAAAAVGIKFLFKPAVAIGGATIIPVDFGGQNIPLDKVAALILSLLGINANELRLLFNDDVCPNQE